MAESALGHARNLASLFDSELLLLRVVVSPYAVVAPDLILAGTDPDLHQLVAHADEYLRQVTADLQSQDLKARYLVCEGPVAEAILDHADMLDIEMIIMSTHGRGGVSRWVYGSVAERVLQGARCPVLLVRSREEQ